MTETETNNEELEEYWETSENEEFWNKYDQQRCDAIGIVIDKYRGIDEILGTNNGIEIAVSLFGQDRVDDYLNMTFGTRDTT